MRKNPAIIPGWFHCIVYFRGLVYYFPRHARAQSYPFEEDHRRAPVDPRRYGPGKSPNFERTSNRTHCSSGGRIQPKTPPALKDGLIDAPHRGPQRCDHCRVPGGHARYRAVQLPAHQIPEQLLCLRQERRRRPDNRLAPGNRCRSIQHPGHRRARVPCSWVHGDAVGAQGP